MIEEYFLTMYTLNAQEGSTYQTVWVNQQNKHQYGIVSPDLQIREILILFLM